MKLLRCAAMFLAICLLLSAALAENADLSVPKYRDVSVHDPSMIRAEDGTYYIFGSHMAAAKSDDLMEWRMISSNAESGCKLVENVQEQMKDALRYAKTATFWAPDVRRLRDGRYYLYYCACEGSSPLSALGLAVSDKPEGPYENLGIFLKSGYPGYDATVYPNVVDPCVFFDQEDSLWMVYGSYSGGIYILEMDPDTGFPLENKGYGKKLLGGYCFEPAENDTNKARTAFRSPGHNSAYYDAETGRYFIVFHTRYAGRGEMYPL